MTIDTIVCNPKRIESLTEVEDILKRIDTFHQEYVPEANGVGVGLLQNNQLGAIYLIVSREEAEKSIKHPKGCEWYVKFFDRPYFENLRIKLQERT